MFSVWWVYVWIFHGNILPVTTTAAQDGADDCSTLDFFVNCSHRSLNYIPSDLPPNASVLVLSFNPIKSIRKDDLRRPIFLRKLDISHCQLNNISSGSFDFLDKLEILDLSYNALTSLSLPKGVFQPLRHLRTLDLTYNGYSKRGQFLEEVCRVPSLQNLQIEGSLNLTFPVKCNSLKKLLSLEFGPCDIQHLSNKTFWSLHNSSLSSICMKLCNLQSAESGVFSQLNNLTFLDLSKNGKFGLSNAIASLKSLQNRNISYLSLSDVNYNTHDPDEVIMNKKNLEPLSKLYIKELNISGNSIVSVSSDGIKLKFWAYIEILDASRNTLQTLVYVNLAAIKNMKNLQFLDVSYQPEISTYHVLSTATNRSGMGSTNFDFPPKLMVLNFSHIRPLIPMRWERSVISQPNSVRTIDFSFSDFEYLGALSGLKNLESFDISGLRDCTFDFNLAAYPALKTFKACNTNIGNKYSTTDLGGFFSGAHNLTHIDLSNNDIHILTYPTLKDQYESLLTLNLSNNFLKNVPLTLGDFKHLKQLDISKNKIERLSNSTMSEIDQFRQTHPHFSLSIGGNNLSCRCRDVDFLVWICETTAIQETDRKSYCIQDDGDSKLIENLCNNLDTVRKKCFAPFWLIFSSVSLGVVCLLLVISAILYRNRAEVKYYVLRFSVRARRYRELEGRNVHFMYDAFVAYSHHDHQWVCQDMRRRLEGNHGFRLCLHHRDFPVAVPISHNIMETMEKSRKVILVVSRHFVRSDWAEFELEMATMFRSQHQRDMLVVVLLESIPYKDMPRTLRGIWRKITCLEWPQDSGSLADVERFWSELVKTLKGP